MSSNRYRVSVNGFKCTAETWDDAGQWDGKHDEVFISTNIKYVDKQGNVLPTEKTSPVMGDTRNQSNRVQTGSASDRGGIISGDYFPTRTEIIWTPSTIGAITLPFTAKPIPPWVRSNPFPDPQDVPPFIAWEGNLTQNQDVVFITPTIWEWDPGQSMWTGWLQGLAAVDTQLGAKAKQLVAGKWPQTGPIFDAVSLGIQTLVTLQKSGVIGNSGSRPIGMTLNTDGKSFSFNPQILALTFDMAETIVTQQPSGLGLGVIALRYMDDPYLRGDYSMYLQVERL